MINGSIGYLPIKVLAEEVQNNDDSTYNKMMEQEVENDTTKFNSSFEKKLNEAGFMDYEIDDFDKQYAEILKTAVNTEVYVNYIEVEKDDINKVKTTDDINYYGKVLNDEEVDELISDTYNFKEDESLGSKVMSLIGLKPMEVYASSLEVESTSYLRQSIGVTEFKNSGKTYVVVNYTATWLKNPSNTYNDIAAITWSGGARFTKDFAYKAEYRADLYKYSWTFLSGEETTNTSVYKNITANMEGYLASNTAGVNYELGDNYYLNTGDLVMEQEYTNQRILMRFYLKKGSDGSDEADYFDIYSKYFHQVKSVKIDGISIGVDIKGTISLGASASVKESYQNAGIQVYLEYYYK